MTRLVCKLSFQKGGKGDRVRAGGWGQQKLLNLIDKGFSGEIGDIPKIVLLRNCGHSNT